MCDSSSSKYSGFTIEYYCCGGYEDKNTEFIVSSSFKSNRDHKAELSSSQTRKKNGNTSSCNIQLYSNDYTTMEYVGSASITDYSYEEYKWVGKIEKKDEKVTDTINVTIEISSFLFDTIVPEQIGVSETIAANATQHYYTNDNPGYMYIESYYEQNNEKYVSKYLFEDYKLTSYSHEQTSGTYHNIIIEKRSYSETDVVTEIPSFESPCFISLFDCDSFPTKSFLKGLSTDGTLLGQMGKYIYEKNNK